MGDAYPTWTEDAVEGALRELGGREGNSGRVRIPLDEKMPRKLVAALAEGHDSRLLYLAQTKQRSVTSGQA